MTSSGESPKRNSSRHANFLRVSLLLLPFCDVFAVEHGGVCTNPDRVQGTCIEINSCAPLLSALQIKPIPPATVDFLRRSQCGFQGGNPLVCCPSDGQAPNVTATTTRPVAVTEPATEDVSQHPNLELLRMDTCGPVFENQIYLGTSIHLMELPWVALLAYTVDSGSPFKCGGSIINDRYVLTAAHCVTGLRSNLSLVSVRLGEHNLTSPIDCEMEVICAPAVQDIPVEEVIPHPRYVGKPNLQYDIALVRLSRPANFTNEAVKPICLPVEPSQQTENLVGKYVTVSGWGVSGKNEPSSPVLRKWSVPVVTYALCSESLTGGRVPVSNVSQICAGGVRDAVDACSGDSGGPLTYIGVVRRRPRIIQHGVLSYGPRNCGSAYQPGVYTRVGHFMKWILDTIQP